MTRDEFHTLVLGYPDVVETSTDDGTLLFTVGNRPFARIRPDAPKFMDVMLRPADSEAAGAGEPELFAPLPGTWLKPGYLQISIKAGPSAFTTALDAAWAHAARGRIARRHRKAGTFGLGQRSRAPG